MNVNEKYAEFVLNYAKKDGLYSLVRSLDVTEDKTHLKADLQPDLINAFFIQFPNIELSELDNTVEWVLITSISKMREKEKNASKL